MVYLYIPTLRNVPSFWLNRKYVYPTFLVGFFSSFWAPSLCIIFMQLLPIKRTAYMKGINKKSITHSVLSEFSFSHKEDCLKVFSTVSFSSSVSITHAKQYMSSENEN